MSAEAEIEADYVFQFVKEADEGKEAVFNRLLTDSLKSSAAPSWHPPHPSYAAPPPPPPPPPLRQPINCQQQAAPPRAPQGTPFRDDDEITVRLFCHKTGGSFQTRKKLFSIMYESVRTSVAAYLWVRLYS